MHSLMREESYEREETPWSLINYFRAQFEKLIAK